MHLITGLLLATLFHKRSPYQKPVLPLPGGVIELAHFLPGRVRFRIPRLVESQKAPAFLKRKLAGIDGVESCEVNAMSGSVLIRYDQDQIDADILCLAAARLLGMDNELERPPKAIVGKEIINAGEAANRAVYKSSGGIIDLWTAIPLVLLGFGIRKLLAGNSAGYTLLWWAYMSFFPKGKINQE